MLKDTVSVLIVHECIVSCICAVVRVTCTLINVHFFYFTYACRCTLHTVHVVIGASLSEPHIHRGKCPTSWGPIYLSIYVCGMRVLFVLPMFPRTRLRDVISTCTKKVIMHECLTVTITSQCHYICSQWKREQQTALETPGQHLD